MENFGWNQRPASLRVFHCQNKRIRLDDSNAPFRGLTIAKLLRTPGASLKSGAESTKRTLGV